MSDLHTFRPRYDDQSEDFPSADGDLAALRDELEHTYRLATLGTLAAGISHEINNILTPVLAYAQLASNNTSDRQLQAKALEKTIRGVQTATQITQAMLGFAGSPDEPDCACVLDVVRSALDCIGRDPAKDGIRLALNIHPETCVRMRPLALQQVLINLILNACAAMGTRGGELSISAVERSDNSTTIRIADNGPGIPAEIAGRLFEPFASSSRKGHAAASRTTNQRAGSGLGLSICKRLVEAASGTISATSSPGKGTIFSLVLTKGRLHRVIAS